MPYQEEVIIKVQADAVEAIKRQQDLRNALESAREEYNRVVEAQGKNSAAAISMEASIKTLNQQISANGRVLTQIASNTTEVSGAYAALNQKAAEAAQRAKDLSVAYGANDARTKEAVASAKSLSDQLKEVDKSVGQNQRSVGDYGIALKKLPGIFGEMQTSAISGYNSIKSGIAEVRGYISAINSEKAAKAEAIATTEAAAITETQLAASEAAVSVAATEVAVAETARATATSAATTATTATAVASEAAATAETQLAASEAAGAVAATEVAAAETARATATSAATVATNASSASMKILKVAIASTGIGLLVIALGSLSSYFTSTNDGAKVFQKIMSGVNAVIQSSVKIMGSLGRLIFDVLTGNVSKLGEDLKTVVNNVKTAGGDIINTYKAGDRAAQNRQMMNKREREWMVERTKLEGDYAVLVQNAGKRSRLDEEGKLKAAKEAIRLKELIYQNDLKIANNNLKVINQEQALNSKKDYQAIADAQNKVQQIIATHKQEQNSVENLMGKTEQRISAADKASVKSAESAKQKRIEAIQRENDENTKLEKELQAFKLKTLKENADADIAAVQDEAKLIKLKNEERLAGQKRTDAQIHDQKISDANDAANAELSILDAKLLNEQITQDEYNKQSILIAQQRNTDLAIIDAEYEDVKRQNRIAAAAADLENELAIAENKGQMLFDLQIQQNEAKRLQEVADAEKIGADVTLVNQKYAAIQTQIELKKKEAILGMASDAMGNFATIAGKNTKVGKMAASAQTAIDTYKGAISAYSSLAGIPIVGPALGAVAAGAAVASGLKAIKDIWAVKSGLPGDGGGGGSAVSLSTATVPAAVTGGLVARSSGQTQVQGTQQAVSNALEQNPQQPVLVVQDVTQAQGNVVKLKNDNSL